jgi:hypothetical protein
MSTYCAICDTNHLTEADVWRYGGTLYLDEHPGHTALDSTDRRHGGVAYECVHCGARIGWQVSPYRWVTTYTDDDTGLTVCADCTNPAARP